MTKMPCDTLRSQSVPHRGAGERRADRRPGCRSRRGATSLEFAVVSPLLFLITLAMFQFGGLMLVQNVLTAAAREGSRVAALSSTSSSETVVAAVQDRLRMGGVDPDLVDIAVNPTALDGLATGDEVTVTVSGEVGDLAFLWPEYMAANPTLSAEMTYNRE